VRKCRAVRVPQPVPPGYYFEISALCQVNLGYTRTKLLFGATYLLQLRRQFLAPMHAEAACRTSKLPLRWRLLRSHASSRNVGLEIILCANGRSSDSAKHCDLAHMRQGVSHRTLE
jgi:hypothetical protein